MELARDAPGRTRGCWGFWSFLRRMGVMNFYFLHVFYIMTIVFICSALLYWVEPSISLFWDAFFDVIALVCLTGFLQDDLTQFTTGAQVICLIAMTMGGIVFVTIPVVSIRLYFVERAFHEVQLERELVFEQSAVDEDEEEGRGVDTKTTIQDFNLGVSDKQTPVRGVMTPGRPLLRGDGVGKSRRDSAGRSRHVQFASGEEDEADPEDSDVEHERMLARHALVMTPQTLSSNPEAGSLVLAQRFEIEAMRSLVRYIVWYIVVVHLFGTLCLGTYFSIGDRAERLLVVSANEDGSDKVVLNPWWFGFFMSASCFSNAGVSLVHSSFVPLQNESFVLWVCTALIYLGGGLFPVALRLLVGGIAGSTRVSNAVRVRAKYLLAHSRNLYTHLFNDNDTRVLLMLTVGASALQSLLFWVGEINNASLDDLDVWQYLANGVFMSACTRTAGFASVDPKSMRLGYQFVQLLLMYVAVYPMLFTIRATAETQQNADRHTLERFEKKLMAIRKEERMSILNAPAPQASGEAQASGLRSRRTRLRSHDSYILRLPKVSANAADVLLFGEQDSTGRRGPREEEDWKASSSVVQPTSFRAHASPLESNGRKSSWLNPDALPSSSHRGGLLFTPGGEAAVDSGTPAAGAQESWFKVSLRNYSTLLLYRDVVFLTVTIAVILYAEEKRDRREIADEGFIFKVLYEIVSAFGTVGLTFGDGSTCFTAGLNAFSRVLVMAVMLAGRHRGLPGTNDPAVLPSSYTSLREYRRLKRQKQQSNAPGQQQHAPPQLHPSSSLNAPLLAGAV